MTGHDVEQRPDKPGADGRAVALRCVPPEAYAAALTSHGHPMPYRLHSELAMYRSMFGPSRPPTR